MKEILSNGSMRSIAQAIEEMKAEQGESFSLENINLAELERRSGVSRGKLRRLKRNGFQDLPRATKGRKYTVTKLSGYTGIIDSLLKPVDELLHVRCGEVAVGFITRTHEHEINAFKTNF